MGTRGFTTRLVGVSFCEGYPENLLQLRQYLEAGESAPLRLQREPDNPSDSNAINVMCVAAGGLIGRLNRNRASRMAAGLDRGEVWRGEVEVVLVDPSYPDNPGVIVRCWQLRAL
jgi:hypothetical protein